MDSSKNGMAIAGLVLGIVSLVFSFFIGWLGLIAGVVGIVLSVKGRQSEKKGLGTAGLVCSIIGTVLSLLTLACVLCALGITMVA